MTGKTIVFVAASLVLAAVFIRLGVWQVDRLRERRQHNAFLEQRLHAPAVPLANLAGTADELRYRRATVSGRADYDHQIVYASRTREGSPGVYLLTPVVPSPGDTAILVARGWVYAPDGATIDVARWREPDSLTFAGYLDELPTSSAISDAMAGRPATVTRLDRSRLEKRIGRPLRAVYLLATADSGARSPETPARFTLPLLDDGPHRSYAFQWFSFAAIAVVGAGIVIRKEAVGRRQTLDRSR
jgi:surfeit locus 1 family protein